jgi:DNA-binding NarL/FixJ family response regulator
MGADWTSTELRRDDGSGWQGMTQDIGGDGAEGLSVLWLAHDELAFHGLPVLLDRLAVVCRHRLCRTMDAFHQSLIDEQFDTCVVPSQAYTAAVAAQIGQAKAQLILTSTHTRRPWLGRLLDEEKQPDAWLQEQRIDLHVLQRVFDKLAAASSHSAGEEQATHASGTAGERGLSRVTQRERSVLMLLAQGRSNQQIARALGISIHGVKRHVSNLLIKLDSSNRTEVALKVARLGLLPSD